MQETLCNMGGVLVLGGVAGAKRLTGAPATGTTAGTPETGRYECMGLCTREMLGTMGGVLVLGDVAGAKCPGGTGATAGTSYIGRCVGVWTLATMVGVLVLGDAAKIGRLTPLTLWALVGLTKIRAHPSNAKRTIILMWLIVVLVVVAVANI
jgi:hypothetical protein